jgi:hypothetical protein
MTEPWRLRGEFVMSCNCDWCPCAVSLGKARPTEGYCLSWFVFRLDEGRWGELDVGGLRLAVLLEVPGRMAEGNYTVGLYLDERSTEAQRSPLEQIFTGQAGGPPGWWRLVIGRYLGARAVAITYEVDGLCRRVGIPKILEGVVEAEPGRDKATPVRVSNMPYWMASEITLARGTRSRFRDWGRNWDLTGRFADIAAFDWQGP